ncbi:MAG: hemin uptake protein HemP [Pseudomonadota bacterium]
MQSHHPDPDTRRQPLDVQPSQSVGSNSGQPQAAKRTSSQALFLGSTELEIEHNGALYRLRQTSLGKLILTK